jgi:transcriptional regulator with XRE-family HTH domain
MKRFGEKLRTLRQRRSLTLRQLAAELGVSNGYISRMETGDKIPNVAMLVKIADFFEADINQLVKDDLELED